MTEQEALLVLNAVPNLGSVRVRSLMGFFGTARAVCQASWEDLSHCALINSGVVHNIFHFSKDKFLQGEYNLMQRKGVFALTLADKDFPCSLKDLPDGPVVLYIKGNAACLVQDSVAIVGSRAASFNGCRSAKLFAEAFANAGLAVTSGLARGIDTAAHRGALKACGQTIGVIASGFSHVYPKENTGLIEKIAEKGAVVSEFAFNMYPLKHNFPWRNRIISALSLATVVIEAGKKSGALITADYALAQNKDVFCLPANVDNECASGSNQLLRDGAHVALSPDDVLCLIKPGLCQSSQGGQKAVLLSNEQEMVYPFITHQPVHVDELARQSGMSISRLMEITLGLELRNAIRVLPGQYYVRNDHA